MGYEARNAEARTRLRQRGEHHLRLIESHALDIPRRLYGYHPDLFLVLNTRTGRFEVHSLGHRDGDTFAMDVRCLALDERVLRDVWRNDVRAHGRSILRRIRQSQVDAHFRTQRRRSAERRALLRETRPLVARDFWNPQGSKVAWGWGD